MHLAIVCERLTLQDDVADQARLLAQQFAALGHRVSVLAAVGLDATPRDQVQVRLYNRRGWHYAPGLIGFRRWLRSNLASLQPDRTIALTSLIPADMVIPSAGTAARYAGALRAIRGPFPVCIGAWARSICPAQLLRRAWERRIFADPSVKVIIADNDVIDAELRLMKGIDHTRIHRVGPAASARPIAAADAQPLRQRLARALDLDEDAAWLVFPFRSAWLDGFEPLMLAFKAMTDRGVDATLLLAGPFRYTHLAWVAQLGLRERIRFLGRPDHPDQLLAAADLLVQPTRHDPGGAWAFAALAMGLPVLTTDASGAATSIGPASGTVLPSPVAAGQLAETLKAAIESALPASRGGLASARPPAVDLSPRARVLAILALLDPEAATSRAESREPA